MNKFVIAAIGILLIVTTLFGCTQRKREKDLSESSPLTEIVPEYVLQDVVHYHYEFGILRTKVLFESGAYFAGKDELHVENCSFVYYDSNGEVESRGQSKRATLYQNESFLIAEEDVVVISEINGATLATDYLEWHGNNDQFTTESFVTITRENGDKLQGIGMIADVALRYVTIKKNVRGSIKAD